MKVIYNVALFVSKDLQIKLGMMGVDVEEGFTSFKIEKNNDRWCDIERIANDNNAIITASTTFTQKELGSSSYLRMVSDWHYGYPEPSNCAGYLENTFSLENYCEGCGCGLQQTSEFRIKSDPKWGKKSFLQLNWVFDEFFVRPELWFDINKRFYLKNKPVKLLKNDNISECIVQLDIPEVDVRLEPVQNGTICEVCGVAKYQPQTEGFFSALMDKVDMPIFKLPYYFGSGHRAYKPVIVTNEFYSYVAENKYKGVKFIPSGSGHP